MEASAPERWLSKMLNPTLFMWNNGLGCLWNSNCNFPGKDILFSVGAYWGWGTNSCFNPTRRIPSTIQFPSWCSRPAHRHGPSSVAYHQWVPWPTCHHHIPMQTSPDIWTQPHRCAVSGTVFKKIKTSYEELAKWCRKVIACIPLAVAKATKVYSWFQLGTNASDYNQNASWNVDKLMNFAKLSKPLKHVEEPHHRSWTCRFRTKGLDPLLVSTAAWKFQVHWALVAEIRVSTVGWGKWLGSRIVSLPSTSDLKAIPPWKRSGSEERLPSISSCMD